MNYKILGQTGLKVSELCLGTMGFGTEWGWGVDKAESFKILDAFTKAGGNFLDTANMYTEGTSEKIIGEYVKAERDNFVIATKYTLKSPVANVNASGNNRKNMIRSVEESLKRLDTDYIDVFYLHIWDHLTPIDEVMRGFQDLIAQGKINYIAISDTPAWIVASANTMANALGWHKLAALQVEYSLLARTPERELLPMAQHFGMSITPWAPLGGGALTGKYLLGDKGRIGEGSKRLNERAEAITRKVMAIAEATNVQPGTVALKWVMAQHQSIIPIVGAKKESQIEANLEVLNYKLSKEHLTELNEISAIEMGFPHEFFKEPNVINVTYGGYRDKIII